MLVDVVGIRRNYSFQTKDNQTISGSSIYCLHPQNGVEGLVTEKYFLNSRMDVSQIVVPCKLEIFFNSKGKVDTWKVHSK